MSHDGEPTQEELDAWPDCPKRGCENKVCQWAGSGLCYPHSVELVGETEMERRYADTRAAFPSDRRWSGNVGGLEGA